VCIYVTDFSSPVPALIHKAWTPPQEPNHIWGDAKLGTNTKIGSDMVQMAKYPMPADESKQMEADDLLSDRFVYSDSVTTIGTYDGVTMVATYENGGMPTGADRYTGTHLSESTECESLGMCDAATQTVGSMCVAPGPDGHGNRTGFCYESAAATLECGRAVSTTTHFGVTTISAGPGAVIYPCPRKTPIPHGAPTGQVVSVVRGPYGGCMISTDANFNKHATFHVPQKCAVPAHYKQGCPLAGARNFVPGAAEITQCHWETGGCMDADAANYDSTATIDDGSCITKIVGCPIKETIYDGVTEGTPKNIGTTGYSKHDAKTEFVMGKHVVETYTGANWKTPGSCTVAIEGCMEASAVNYDPHATVQSSTWCVPKVVGCMDPAALSFNPSATVHNKADCTWRYACPEVSWKTDEFITIPKTSEYNSHMQGGAKYPDKFCWLNAKPGCLDPYAKNYGCSSYGETPCVDSGAYLASPSQDVYTKWSIAMSNEGVTFHMPPTCYYGGDKKTIVANTLVELTSNNPGVDEAIVVSAFFSISVGPCEVTKDITDGIQAAFALKYGVDVQTVTVEVTNDADCVARRRLATTDGGAGIRVSFTTPNAAGAKTIADAIAAEPLTPNVIDTILVDYSNSAAGTAFANTLASSNLAATSGAELTFTYAGTYVDPSPPPSPPPPAPPPSNPKSSSEDNTGAIVGGVVGGVVLLLLCGVGAFMYRKKMATKEVYPA